MFWNSFGTLFLAPFSCLVSPTGFEPVLQARRRADKQLSPGQRAGRAGEKGKNWNEFGTMIQPGQIYQKNDHSKHQVVITEQLQNGRLWRAESTTNRRQFLIFASQLQGYKLISSGAVLSAR
jgi:hypothetical protein